MMPQRFDRTLAPDSSELRKGAIAPAQSAMNAAGALIATVILPAYNEAEALPSVLSGLFAVLDRRYEVIVVNDASSDDTATIAQRYPCQLLNHPFNRGKGAAVRTGLMVARGRFIIVMDADNTYPPEAIPEMVQALQEVDFVRCSRSVGASNISTAWKAKTILPACMACGGTRYRRCALPRMASISKWRSASRRAPNDSARVACRSATMRASEKRSCAPGTMVRASCAGFLP